MTSVPNFLPFGVKNLFGMFYFAINFNSDITSWNTSQVQNMKNMFSGAVFFNQPIGGWNTSQVTSMKEMFVSAESFNQPIGGWNTSQVEAMTLMFSLALEFNQPIGKWNTSKVITMGGMFSGAVSFNQPIGKWNTSKVKDMSLMFGGAVSFNQPIGNWDVSKVTIIGGTIAAGGMLGMFQYATSFNQNLSTWKLSKEFLPCFMFDGATSFNQNLGTWKIDKVVLMVHMLDNSGLDTTNYSNTLIGWASQNIKPVNRKYPVQLGAQGLFYNSAGKAARKKLTNPSGDNWTIMGDTYIPSPPPPAPVCFVKGTPISTDSGIISIEKINPNLHTINKKKIVAITQTIYPYNYLICFEKHSLGRNYPNERTIMTSEHKVFYDGKMMEAGEFVGFFKNVYKVKYNGDVLYNVLMKKYDTIRVNNLLCETLHPSNIVAKLNMGGFTEYYKEKIVEMMRCSENTNTNKLRK